MKNILITGVSGYFGWKLIQFLDDRPEVKRIVGIDIRPPQYTSNRLEFIRCDVRENLDRVFADREIDCVIHTAYILPPMPEISLMEDININGARNVITAAARHRVSQILDCSSSTAYGFHPDNPAVLTEESPLRGNDDFTYAKNKKEIDAWIRVFEEDCPDIVVTTIRPCFVVGPGFTNPLARHLTKKICIMPLETSPFQFIHEDDLVEIMYLLLKKRKAGIYNLAADGTMTFDDMIRILGGLSLKLPVWLLWPINNLMWRLRMTFVTEFPSPCLNMIRYPWIASNKKVKEELGYAFRYTTREAFEDFARHVKSSGGIRV